MTTQPELRAAISTLLDHSLGIRRFEARRLVNGKMYEAYVFGLCLQALQELGADLRASSVTGSPGRFIFRGGAGQIYSRTRNYGHVEFTLNEKQFELHSSIEYCGTSGMFHEIDVSVLSAQAAWKCRETSVSPRPSSLVGAWECKFYTGRLPKEVGRTFVGLLADMGSSFRVSGLCSNTENQQLGLYYSKKNRPHAHFHLTPREHGSESDFVSHVKNEFKKLAPPQ